MLLQNVTPTNHKQMILFHAVLFVLLILIPYFALFALYQETNRHSDTLIDYTSFTVSANRNTYLPYKLAVHFITSMRYDIISYVSLLVCFFQTIFFPVMFIVCLFVVVFISLTRKWTSIYNDTANT